MRPWRPRALGERLSLLVVVVHALVLALMVVGLWAILGKLLSVEANDALQARSRVEVAALPAPSARLAPPSASLPGEGDTWLVVGGRALSTPRVAPSITKAALLAAARPGHLINAGSMRFYAAKLTYRQKSWGLLVTGVALAPYHRTQTNVLLGAIAFSVVVVATVGLTVKRLVARALRPVSEMTAAAAVWSVEEPDRRFGAGPAHDEISQLAATLDLLLDRLAAALRAEQLLTAEVAHELRGPLAAMRSEAELALRRERSPAEYRESIEAMLGSATHLTQASDALVASAAKRPVGELGRCLVADAFADLAHSCQPAAASRSVDVRVDCCDGLAVGAQREAVVELLHPIVENACQHARSAVHLSAASLDGSWVELCVSDDGCGVAAADVERIFEPGERGSSLEDLAHDGAGLGLALARRLAQSLGGGVTAQATNEGGRFVVKLPAG